MTPVKPRSSAGRLRPLAFAALLIAAFFGIRHLARDRGEPAPSAPLRDPIPLPTPTEAEQKLLVPGLPKLDR